jgi:negative regulator of flagellin synthesis FlgM
MRMDTRNNLDGLKSLLGVESAATPAADRSSRNPCAQGGSLESDHATLSSAASEVSQAAREDVVRTEKVASIQAALAAGTYEVPASAVATKIVDAMLAGQK